jgi:hypothetical protein
MANLQMVGLQAITSPAMNLRPEPPARQLQRTMRALRLLHCSAIMVFHQLLPT